MVALLPVVAWVRFCLHRRPRFIRRIWKLLGQLEYMKEKEAASLVKEPRTLPFRKRICGFLKSCGICSVVPFDNVILMQVRAALTARSIRDFVASGTSLVQGHAGF